MTAVNTGTCLCVLVVILSLGQLSTAEYHYKIRGPPRPPVPPLPPSLNIHRPMKHPNTFYKTKFAGPRIVSTQLRGPPHFMFDHHHHHHPPHFHSLPHSPNNVHVGRPPVHKPQTLLLSHGGGAGFVDSHRSQAVKDYFPSLQLNNFEFHTTAKPVPPEINYHHLGVDDDKGPIHTIPAPNLSLLDKPHSSLSTYPSPIEGGFSNHGIQANNHLQETQSVLSTHSLAVSQQPLLGAHQVSVGTYGGSGVTIQPSLSYQVREETNDQAGQTLDGKPVYFAPDPDPNLPAPKIPPTSDPHSVPSNGRSPVELLVHHLQSQGTPLQLFETNTNVMHDGQSLSSQDLYRLLQGSLPQQQQLLDTYPLPILQQPQLQQHILQQQAAGYPSLYQYQQHGEVADNSLALRTGNEDFRPQLHTFNYEERAADQLQYASQQQYSSQSPYSSQPHYSTQLLGHLGDDELAESAPEPKVIRSPSETAIGTVNDRSNINNSDGVTYSDTHREGSETRNEVEGDGETKFQPANDNSASSAFYSKVAQGTQLYTTLPNREAAEALATLAAAGNFNSNFMNRLKGEPEDEENTEEEGNEEYKEEEEEDEEEEDANQEDEEYSNQQPSTAAPSTVAPDRRLPQTYVPRQRYQPTRGQLTGYYQVRHEERNRLQEEAEESFDENTGDGQESGVQLQFGARIRPKRDDGSGD